MAKFSRNRNNAKRNSKRRNRSGGRVLGWWNKERGHAPEGSLGAAAADQQERDERGLGVSNDEGGALERANLWGGARKRKQRNTRRNRRGGKRTNKNRKNRNNRNKKTRRQRRR